MHAETGGVIVTRLVDDGSEYRPDDMLDKNVYTTTMDFPFSIFVWHAPRRLIDKPFWQEELRANNQQMAIYAAGLLYQAGVPHGEAVRERPVVKVMRYGLTQYSFPDEHTVELCDKQIARYNELHPPEPAIQAISSASTFSREVRQRRLVQ